MNNNSSSSSSSSSSRDQPFRFVGKISNLYQPPSYYTSNLIRRLHNDTHVMSSRDRTVLDLYGELESMRMRYAPDPIIPQKADLYELSLHELWGRAKPSGQKRGHYNPFEPSSPSEAFVNGTELGHNTIAVATEAINEEALFLHAMKVFSHQPRIAHFMLCSTKANVLQEFCWPVDLVHDETTRMEDLFQKRDFFRSTFDNDRIGDTDLDRSLMLSNEVKSFTPLLLDGQAVWSENYHIVPRHRAFERVLRQPPTVFVEMARNGIQEHVANDGFIAMKRPRLHATNETPPPTRFQRPAPLITGKDIVHASVSSITIEGMTMRSMPGLKPDEALSSLFAGRSSHERVLAPRSLGRAPSIQQSLKEQAFELTIARHLETMLDGLLEAVFQFLLPMLRIAAEDPLPVGTESMGTFKLSSRRPSTPGDPANTTVNEEEALLEYLSKSAALAIDSIRFHGDSSTSPRRNVDPPAEEPTDDEGRRNHLLDGDDDTSSKRRRLEVECHREKLYVEYRPSATAAASSSSSSLVRRRGNTLRQPPRAAPTASATATPSRIRRSMNASAAADVATAATSAGGETKTLKVKRRRLDIRCHLGQQDRTPWEQRVQQHRAPKSILGLRAHLRRLHRLPPPPNETTATSSSSSSVTARGPAPSAMVDTTTEYINDDSTTDGDDDEEEEKNDNGSRRGKRRVPAASSRRRSPRKPTAADRASVVAALAAPTTPVVSAYQQNQQRKRRKRLLPTLVPLPVPLAQIYLPQSTHTRLARRMLRWQAGGVMGAGRQALQWHRPILSRRRTRVVPPVRRQRSKTTTSSAAAAQGDGLKSNDADPDDDDDDDNDLSVISAITCEGGGEEADDDDAHRKQSSHRRRRRMHLLLDQSSVASLTLSSITEKDHDGEGDDNVEDDNVEDDDDDDDEDDDDALPPAEQPAHGQRSKTKVTVPAPSVPGTLETGYLYHEPHINVHTGQFEDPVRRRSTAADAHPAPSTATTAVTATAAASPASSSARIVNEERQRVNWEHILIVLELIRDIAMGDKPVQTGPGRLTEPIRLRIHPDLPAIPLDDLALTRIRYHLTAVFTNFLREHEAQHQPQSTMKDRRPPSHAFLAAVPQVIRQPARYPRGGGSHGRPPPVTAPPSFLLFDHDTVHAMEAGKTATAAASASAMDTEMDDARSLLSSIEDDSSDDGDEDGDERFRPTTNAEDANVDDDDDDPLPQLMLPPSVRFAPPSTAPHQRRTTAATGQGTATGGVLPANADGDDADGGADGGARRVGGGGRRRRDPQAQLQRRQRLVYGYGASSTSLLTIPQQQQQRQLQQQQKQQKPPPLRPTSARRPPNLHTFPRPAVLAAQRLSQRYQDYMQHGAWSSSSLLASVSASTAASALTGATTGAAKGTKRARALPQPRWMDGPTKRPRYDDDEDGGGGGGGGGEGHDIDGLDRLPRRSGARSGVDDDAVAAAADDDDDVEDNDDNDEDYDDDDAEDDDGDSDDDRATRRQPRRGRKRPRRDPHNPYDRYLDEEDNDDDEDNDIDAADDDDADDNGGRWPSTHPAASAMPSLWPSPSSSSSLLSPTKLARGSSVIPGTTPRAYSSPKKAIVVGPRARRAVAATSSSSSHRRGGDDRGGDGDGGDDASLSPGASVAGSVHEYDLYPPLPSAFAPPPLLVSPSPPPLPSSLPPVNVKTEPEAPPRRVAMTRSMRHLQANAAPSPPTASAGSMAAVAPSPPSASTRSRSQGGASSRPLRSTTASTTAAATTTTTTTTTTTMAAAQMNSSFAAADNDTATIATFDSANL